MWQNVDDLVSPMESVACVAKPIVDVVSSYPIINFSNVNKHFLSNLPEPARAFPHSWLLSRSRPKLLWTTGVNGCVKATTKIQNTTRNIPPVSPSDSKPILGLVVGTTGAVHGYIWNGYQWVLKAKRPQDREKFNKKSESDSNFKKKFKRIK